MSIAKQTLHKNASSLNFSKHNAHVISLCLTLHINLELSLRKTSQALKDLYSYQVSENRRVGPLSLLCSWPFRDFTFQITQVIGLANDDAISIKHRPFKQIVERLNRTYKASCRKTNSFDNIEGAGYPQYAEKRHCFTGAERLSIESGQCSEPSRAFHYQYLQFSRFF